MDEVLTELRRQSAYLGQNEHRRIACAAAAFVEEQLLAIETGGGDLDERIALMVSDLLAAGWGYRRVATYLGLDSNTVLHLQRRVRGGQALRLTKTPDELRANPDARKDPHREGGDDEESDS